MYTTLHQVSAQNGKLLNTKLQIKIGGFEQLRIHREVRDKYEEKQEFRGNKIQHCMQGTTNLKLRLI